MTGRDREFYETVIEFRADGIARTKDEIDDLTKSLNDAAAAGQILEDDTLNNLTAALSRMKSEIDQTEIRLEAMARGFSDVVREAAKANKVFREFNAEDAVKGGPVNKFENLSNFTDAELKQAIAAQDALTLTVEGTARAYFNLKNQIEQVDARRGQAKAAADLERELAGVDELQAAYIRVGHAKRAVRDAEANRAKADDPEKELQAVRELEKAERNLATARKNVQAVSQRRADDRVKEEAREVKELEKSLQNLSKAYRDAKNSADKGFVAGPAAIEAAEDRVLKARFAVYQNQANLVNLMGESRTTAQTAQATQGLADAYTELAGANAHANRVAEETVDRMPRLRYAMYDVSEIAAIAGAALTAFGVAGTVMATGMDHAFANVVRTTETYLDATGSSVVSLRKEFDELFATMPTSWGNLTEIGTLAGQLNIASDSVGEFTKLVQQFASSTNVSVEASATAFGRLSQILRVPASELQNLGSSILTVGVNSVATESQIIAISQNIAGIAVTAGLTADQVFGLSAALASLGTPPELSRGVVTRLFTNIMTSINEAGDSLDQFARYAGMSAEQFAEAWGRDATGALYELMKGIGQLDSQAQLSALNDLGIKQVRDIPAVLRLAQNYDILGQSLKDAADGYREGTALSEHYGVISETVASRIEILKNSFQMLMASFSVGEGIVRGIVDILTHLVNGLRGLIELPVIGHFTQFGLILTAVTGPVLILVGALVRLFGSVLGIRQVLIEAGINLRVFTTQADAATLSTGNLTKAVWGGVTALKGFKTILMGLGLGLVATAISTAVAAFTSSTEGAAQAAEDLKINVDGLVDAMRKDAQAVQDGTANYALFTRAIESSEAATGNWTDSLNQIWGTSHDVVDGVDGMTTSVERYTFALGENTAAALANQLASSESFREIMEANQEVLSQSGFNVADYIESLFEGSADTYIAALQEKAQAWRQGMLEEYEQLQRDLRALVSERDEENRWTDRYTQLSAQIDQVKEQMGALEHNIFSLDFDNVFTALSGQAETFTGDINDAVWATDVFNATMDQLGYSADDLEGSLANATNAVEEFTEGLWGGIDTSHAFESSMASMIDSFINNGNTISEFTEEGRANFAALKRAVEDLAASSGDDLSVFATGLMSMFAQMEGAGIELGAEVDFLKARMIDAFSRTYGVALDTRAADKGIQQFIQNVLAALRARAQLERGKLQTMQLNAPGVTGTSLGLRPELHDSARQALSAQEAALDATNAQILEVTRLGNSIQSHVNQGATNAFNSMGKAADRAGRSTKKAGDTAKKAGKDAASGAKEAKAEIYTLVDYARDLESVWKRAFDIRFSGQQSYDKIAGSWFKIADAFENAEERVRDLRLELRSLNADVNSLQADVSQQEYFLRIALEYGDTRRAEQIQARIGELNAELAKKNDEVTKTTKELGKAQQDTSRDLEGNSEAARTNRGDILGLVQAYQDHIGKLAESGMGTADLQRVTEELRRQFVEQGVQLGYSRADLEKYARAFDDVTYAINNVPRNITVTATANMNPAELAMREWLARKRTVTVDTQVNAPSSVSGGTYRPSSVAVGGGGISTPTIKTDTPLVVKLENRPGSWRNVFNLFFDSGGMVPEYHATGGVAGLHPGRPKGSDIVPAWLTPGEAVTQKRAVDYYGPGFFNALNEMKVPRYFAQGWNNRGNAGAAGALGMVSLSAMTIQQLAAAIKPHLYLDGREVAQSVSRANARSTSVGSS